LATKDNAPVKDASKKAATIPAPAKTAPAVPATPAAPAVSATPAPAAPSKPTINTENKRTTEQFDKLLDSNKELMEANKSLLDAQQRREEANEQVSPLNQPPVQSQAQDKVNPEDFVEIDPVTGQKFINEIKLKDKIEALNTQATNAQRAVQSYIKTSEAKDIDRQNRETFSTYPELNPQSDTHDKEFHRQVRSVLIDSMTSPEDYGGRPMHFKEAADYVKNAQSSKEVKTDVTEPTTTTAAPEGAPATPVAGDATTPVDAAQALKEQAAADTAGQQPPARPQSEPTEDRERLVRLSREGNLEAIARRLANTDHVGEKTTTTP